jgi:uncharacterized membrane protein
MTMNHDVEHSLVATYRSHDAAEDAIRTLQRAGADMTRLSIVGRDFYTQHALDYPIPQQRMAQWAGHGALWGSLWGVLLGSAFFVIPALGPVVVMGPLVATMVSALEGAALGAVLGALSAALTGLGASPDAAQRLEAAVRGGQFLVLAGGSAQLVEHTRALLCTQSTLGLLGTDLVLAPARVPLRRSR